MILRQLMTGETGKTGINSAICYQIATKQNEWDRGADSWGISPSHWNTRADVTSAPPSPIERPALSELPPKMHQLWEIRNLARGVLAVNSCTPSGWGGLIGAARAHPPF